jgi:hypothetical protein
MGRPDRFIRLEEKAMNAHQWPACTDPAPMLAHLRPHASDRQWRLFAVACCRRVWRWLDEDAVRNAVAVAERFADARASATDLAFARTRAQQAAEGLHAYQTVIRYVYESAVAATEPWAAEAASATVNALSWAAQGGVWGEHHAERAQTQAKQCALLREVFGNPFQPVALDSAWLARNAPVVRLARAIYDERAFGGMPQLAEALERGRCPDAALVAHCRQEGEHVRGCWALDRILEKG